jgi:P-type Cu+ transporter
MAKDPVCGMQLAEASAPATSEYKSNTYYFCSSACKAVFEKNPEKYAAK